MESMRLQGPTFIRLLSVILILMTNTVTADERQLPKAMAALGDSITEGMLTDFSVERPPNFRQILALLSAARREDRVEYFRKFYARPSHSWAAGTDDTDFVNSHYERLKKYQPTLVMHNFAISGMESSQLDLQVDALIDTERLTAMHHDYITLMIGANDMRREQIEDITSPAIYEQNIERALRRILEENSDRRILLAGMPQVHEIFETSANFEALSILGESISCAGMRIRAYGPLVLFLPEHSADYQNSKILFSLYQAALVSAAEHLQRDYPSAKIKAGVNYKGSRTTKKTLSIDCFHPSTWGQGEISEKTWKLGFWPNLK